MGAFLSGISFLAKLRAGMFNQAHRGGPGRLLTIAVIGLLMMPRPPQRYCGRLAAVGELAAARGLDRRIRLVWIDLVVG